MATSNQNINAERPSVKDLTVQLEDCSTKDVRKITSEWITRQGGLADQYVGIMDIFDLASKHHGGLNEVVMEAWGMLTDGQAWKARFSTREEAIRALDSAWLKDMRMRARSSRDRKSKYAAAIMKTWGKDVDDWKFNELGENYLGNLAAVADKYDFQTATKMVMQITMMRLRKCQIGRGSSKEILNKDWADLRHMKDEEAKNLLTRQPIAPSELDQFQATFMKLENFKRMLDSNEEELMNHAAVKKPRQSASVIDDSELSSASPKSDEYEAEASADEEVAARDEESEGSMVDLIHLRPRGDGGAGSERKRKIANVAG